MKMRRWIGMAVVLLLLCGTVMACNEAEEERSAPKATESGKIAEKGTVGNQEEPTKEPVKTKEPAPERTKKPDKSKEPEQTKAPKQTATPKATKKPSKRKVIVIDAGHQSKQNSELEAVAPGSSEKKKKVSSGTEGRFTKVPEYKVTLAVSKKLKKELEKQGYTVVMTRETNDVNISNIERAQIANEANADAFIRIHCNGVDNASVHGILTLCPTKNSPYCKSIYKDSYALSSDLLEGMVAATGAKNQGITQTDTMSGINWSKVPVTIVEMGYMTNKEEDNKLVSDEYQDLLVQGMVNGLEKYFSEK